MKEILMFFGPKTERFQITFECDEYCFMECQTNPAARGFYTRQYIINNKCNDTK